MTLSIMSAIKAILHYSTPELRLLLDCYYSSIYYAQKYRRDAELRSSESITLNVKN